MNLPICKNPTCNNFVSYTKKGQLSKYCSNSCKCKENARLSIEKRKKTNLERYGVENVMQNELIKDKFKNNLLEIYGVDNPIKIKGVKEKIKKTLKQKYGVDNVFKLERHRCPNGIENSQRHLTLDTINTLNSKEKLSLLNEELNLTEIGNKLGTAKTTISMRFKEHDIVPKIHYNSTFQKEVKDFIGECETNKKRIWPFELDILLENKNVAIECNGTYWHSELNGKDKNYHLEKTILCEKIGISLLHIWEYDWIQKNAICKSIINAKIGRVDKIWARKTDIVVLNKKQEIEFFERTHLQGYVASQICYGLLLDNKIIAAMSFTKPRFNSNFQWELLRYSNELNISVIGGAKRLFNKFIIENKPTSLISYCHRHLFSGELYKSLGMQLAGYSLPSYKYIKKNEIFNRMAFQKHKLKNKLDNFYPELTEWENMKANGYDRIWDCGNSVWIWINNTKETI